MEATHSGLSYCKGDQRDSVLECTVGDALRLAAANWDSRVALIDGSMVSADPRAWTFGDLLRNAEQVARSMLSRFHPGEHVAIWAPNSPEWIFLEFGAALARITLVTVNPAYQAKELEYVLKQSEAVGLFVVPEYRGRDLLAVVGEIRPKTPALRHVFSFADWDEFLKSPATMTDLPIVAPEDIAQIQYTSGTTGFPKGALLTHRGLSNNARFYARHIGASETDVWVNPMPLFHTAGCGLVTLGALQTGGAHVIPSGFDAGLMLTLIESHKGTITLSVPTMLIAMFEHEEFNSRDLSTWRIITLGGAPVPKQLVQRAEEHLNARVAIGYGQTESSPYITHTYPGDTHADWASTVGRPLPQCEVKIVQPDSGATVATGELGELCTRGYAVMKGYFNNPGATAAALDSDGWLHTGDLATIDSQGYCRIQGRLKDMIIRGGENIYPREIEELLFSHPAVRDAAVVGVPDENWGEIPVAFIRCSGASQPSEEELFAFCRANLASYKTPRYWRFVEQFPQTPSGKVQKFVLRDQFVREQRQCEPSSQ